MITLLPGAVFYLILLLAAVFFDKTGLPGLQVQALSWLVVFLLVGATMSARALGGALAWSAAASAAFCASINLVEFFFLPNEWSTAPGRSAGLLENPNVSALALVGSWVVLYELRAHTRARLVVCTAILATLGLIVTFSRGGAFTAAVIALFLLHRQWRVWRARNVHLMVLLVPIAAGLFIIYINSLWASSTISDDAWMRVNSILTLDFSDDSAQHRSYLVDEYLSMLGEHPVSGYYPFFSISSIDGQGPHNNYLGLGVDFGIPVLLIFVFAATLRIPVRRSRPSEAGSLEQGFLIPTLVLLSCMFSHNIAYSAIGAALLGAIAGLLARFRFEAAPQGAASCASASSPAPAATVPRK